jgi:hypothetical protein
MLNNTQAFAMSPKPYRRSERSAGGSLEKTRSVSPAASPRQLLNKRKPLDQVGDGIEAAVAQGQVKFEVCLNSMSLAF